MHAVRHQNNILGDLGESLRSYVVVLGGEGISLYALSGTVVQRLGDSPQGSEYALPSAE